MSYASDVTEEAIQQRARAEEAEARVVELQNRIGIIARMLEHAGELMAQVPAGQVRGMFSLLGEIDRLPECQTLSVSNGQPEKSSDEPR